MMNAARFAGHVWRLFVAKRKPGLAPLLHLFAICSSVSLLSTVCLFLAGHSFLMEYPTFSLVMSLFLWVILSVGLCSSRHLRCFIALFFLSCGLHEGRNALIAAGTGVVVVGNVQSIFYNLKQLADSVTCILESQSFAFLNHYLAAIWWIYKQSKLLPNPFKDLVSVDDKLNVSYAISDEDLRLKLNHTRLCIQNITNQITAMLALQPYVGKKVLPLLGTIFILLGTYLFIRRFLSPHNIKFKNTYITKEFMRYNEQQWRQGKLSVLPLNKAEQKVYTTVPSFCKTHKERKCTARFFLPVLANLCIWTLFTAIDYLLYWLIFSVSKHLQNFPELEVHLKLYYQVSIRARGPALFSKLLLRWIKSLLQKKLMLKYSPECLKWLLSVPVQGVDKAGFQRPCNWDCLASSMFTPLRCTICRGAVTQWWGTFSVVLLGCRRSPTNPCISS